VKARRWSCGRTSSSSWSFTGEGQTHLLSDFKSGPCSAFSFLKLAFRREEQARESHVYSYSNGFRGFAAKLSEEQAKAMAGSNSTILDSSSLLPRLFLRYLEISTRRNARRRLRLSQPEKAAPYDAFMGFHGSNYRRGRGNPGLLREEPRERHHRLHRHW